MALYWNWDKKCGEATFSGGDTNYTLNLYEGNAYLIMIAEDDTNQTYQVCSFWSDERHMKNCLGLNKKEGWDENIHSTMTRIRLNKKLCKHTKNIVAALVQAFDNIDIEIYSEEKEK